VSNDRSLSPGFGERHPDLLSHLTWPEVREAAEEGRVILQPLGAVEQHGYHLPVDTDNLIVERLCLGAAAHHPGEFLVAPLLPYGFNDHNMEFPGTVSIPIATLIEYLFHVGRSFATMGFKRVLWVNGHGSNEPIVALAARRITNETPAMSAATSSLMLAREAAGQRPELRSSPLGGVAHACEFETALYQHLAGPRVREDLMADEVPDTLAPYASHDWMGSAPLALMTWSTQRTRSGVEGSPSHASAEKGQALFDACAKLLADIGHWFAELNLPERTDLRPAGAWPQGLVG
jgi:creatinine amidohydrolase